MFTDLGLGLGLATLRLHRSVGMQNFFRRKVGKKPFGMAHWQNFQPTRRLGGALVVDWIEST